MAGNNSYTIVEYFGGDDGYRCGYCKNEKGNFSHGMWSHTMTVQDYQDLIDRGWRRSGKYVYKPIMNKTCCPQYTIRCHALNFQPSKTHKKVLKKMNKFLCKGELPTGQGDGEPMDSLCEEGGGPREPTKGCSSKVELPVVAPTESKECDADKPAGSQTARKGPDPVPGARPPATAIKPGESHVQASWSLIIDPCNMHGSRRALEPGAGSSGASVNAPSSCAKRKTLFVTQGEKTRGVGADPSRPPCRKAKELRKERRMQKQREDGISTTNAASPAVAALPSLPSASQAKALEELISEIPDNPLHCLEVRLVRSNPPSPQFKASFDASYNVYKLYQMAIHKDPPGKPSESQVRLVPVDFEDPQFTESYEQSVELYARYQMAIHGDAPSECNESEFKRFLCDSPLEVCCPPDGPVGGYGSFHQQYWLGERLVAVGVVDILPTCVSSVYLYYHPDFASLSLGSYSALREIAFTRQLQKQSPKLAYYYLGFYIHSCPKMRYKGQYQPSDLLCPETFVWESIERCIPRLEQGRYARFNQDPDAGDARGLKDLGQVLVLYRRTVMPYAAYSRKRKGSSDESEVEQYARLLGQVCAEKILLYRA
ncbi:arginyl-tRNA--protein transferase 1 [Aplochiton taeniatus]